MSAVRQNTLVVDFSVLPKRPDAEEIQQFFEKKVKLRLEDTKNIQFHNIKNCVYIEMVDNETAVRYEKANLNRHSIVCNKTRFKIPVYVESEAVTVRVHDLPSHTHHLTVVNYMQQYGVVMSITRERWKNYFPGVYNGVRVLRMKLDKPIPSCVTIDGEKTLVTYRNQPKLCNHCGQPLHPKGKCVRTSVTANSSKTQAQVAPSIESSPQLDGDDFPPLSAVSTAAKLNLEMNSTLTKTQCETEQSEKNNNNQTSGNNDESDDDEDDDDGDDDDDDDDDDEENDNDDDDDDDDNKSDTNRFVEARNQKRRLSKGLQSELASEKKKVCMNPGSQNSFESSNRFQALVEIGSVCPSADEIKEYVNRVNTKKNKNNVSS